MITPCIVYLKLLIVFLSDLLYRFSKFVKYLWSGKHEVERICEAQFDIYEKTLKIDQWLSRTNDKQICSYLREHFECVSEASAVKRTIESILNKYKETSTKETFDTPTKSDDPFINIEDFDLEFSSTLRDLCNELLETIVKAKNLHWSNELKECLNDILYRVISYKLSIVIAEQLAGTKYDASLEVHITKLMSFWNNLVRADQKAEAPENDESPSSKVFPPKLSKEISDKSKVVSSRWSHVGFQGEDPGTDFRGMGLLGLVQLEYLSRKPKQLARDLLQRSFNENHSYPFAIVGINITYNLLELFKDGSMKHLYYDTGDKLFRSSQRTLDLIKTFNDLYVELFLRFDCYWHESKPESIFQFKSIMENFVSIIRMDLTNRNFSLKFIY